MHLIARSQYLLGDTLSIDINMIRTALIQDTISTWYLFQARMMGRNLGMIEHNGVIWCTPKRNYRCTKGDRTYFGQTFLGRSGAIVIG